MKHNYNITDCINRNKKCINCKFYKYYLGEESSYHICKNQDDNKVDENYTCDLFVSELDEFYKEITNWLIPLGFTEIYQNHPCLKTRRFDFIKDRVRVCCVFNDINQGNYCYVLAEVMFYANKSIPPVSIKSTGHEIGYKDIEKVHSFIKNSAIDFEKLVINKNKTIKQKLLNLIKWKN